MNARKLWILLPLSACSISEEDFLQQYSELLCSQIYECVTEESLESIEAIYGSQENCASTVSEELQNELPEGLQFNAQSAQSCLDAFEATQCDDSQPVPADCDLVYTEIP